MYIQSRTTGKLNTIRMRIPMNKLNRVIIPYPPEVEQKAICQSLEKEVNYFSLVMSNYEREIQLLQEYRTRLISDVVTGKLDVREAAKNLPIETIAEPIEDIGDGEDEELEDAA